MLQLQSMQDFHDVSDTSELSKLLDSLIESDDTGAFWIHRDGVCELALFLNGHLAVVYRMTDQSWSLTPGASRDESEYFILENGESSEFALSQCVTPDDGIAAFLETAATGELSDKIAWD